MSDEQVREVLRQFHLRTDPVPASCRAAARGVFAWRDAASELAELLTDSLLSGASVRSQGGPRLLTFATGAHTIEIEVNGTGRTRQVIGQVTPASPGELRPRGTDQRARPDELGRFFFADLPAGRFSLTWRPDDAPVYNTAWIDI